MAYFMKQNMSVIAVVKRWRVSCIQRHSFATQIRPSTVFLKPAPCLSIPINHIKFYAPTRRINFYQLDGIPNEYKIVYQSTMGNYVKWAQLITLGGSLFLTVPLCVLLISTYQEEPLIFNDFVESPFQLTFYYISLIASLIAIQFVMRRVALRIYYNELNNEFIMMLPGTIPKQERQLRFKAGQVKDFGCEKFLSGLRGQYATNTKRFILNESHFQTPHYLNVMLGHDKQYD